MSLEVGLLTLVGMHDQDSPAPQPLNLFPFPTTTSVLRMYAEKQS